MKLKTQPRPTRRPQRSHRSAHRGLRGLTSRSRGAQRPGVPVRRRIARRLPTLARAGALLAAIAATAALVALVNGPWLRVTEVAFAGQHYTDPSELERVLEEQRGTSVLAIDTDSVRDSIARLPAVDAVTVSASVLGRLDATVVEHEVAFVWQTSSGHFLGAADGTIIARAADGEALAGDVAALPQIHDERFAARAITVGEVIPDTVLRTAIELVGLDPAALGSDSEHLALRLDDVYGFRLVSESPQWEIALGAYGKDPRETAAEARDRMERQVAAVRTLFAERVEDEIGWVDVRNPGKVYFRVKG